MRSRLHQWMNCAVAEFLDVLILQSLQDFRFLDWQAVFGRHRRNVVDETEAKARLEAEVVENLVQLVCRRRRMLIKLVSFRTLEFVGGRTFGPFLRQFSGSLIRQEAHYGVAMMPGGLVGDELTWLVPDHSGHDHPRQHLFGSHYVAVL